MGKRELLLIALFGIVGVVAYRVTVPASPDGSGFSVTEWIGRLRNQVQARNYELPFTRSTEATPAATITRVRLDGVRGGITVTGEARETVAVEVKGALFAADEAEARALERTITVTLQPEGDRLTVRLALPPIEQRRRLRLELVVRVPSRLILDIATLGGELDVSSVAALVCERGSGRARFASIAGPVTGEFGPGALEIDQAGSLDLETRRTEVRITSVTGAVTLRASAGDLRIRKVTGATTLALERIDAELEDLGGPLTITGTGGQVRVRDARAAITADTRRMELLLAPAVPVPITATTEADLIEVTLPPGGTSIDALTTNGDLRVPDGTLTVQESGDERRAKGPLRGGGPLITLRTSRGDIVIR